MILKHCMKFTAAEITELVKITKQEIGALAATRNKMLLLLIDSLDSSVLLSYVRFVFRFALRKFITISDPTNTTQILYLNLEATSHRL